LVGTVGPDYVPDLLTIIMLPLFLNRLEELLLIQRPRFGTVSFNWSPDGHRFRLPRTPINLSRKIQENLKASSFLGRL
jgi:hypothetical protein